MLTVFQYGDIRRAHRDGMSIREIARTFHHSRKTIRQVLAEAEPRPYTRTQPTPAPVLGAFHGIIDAILADDENAPPKQRHTASQVFRRLRDEHGYRGSYDQVRRYVGQHRRDRRETFIPLAHDPGQRLEADFGHIYVDFPGGRKQVPVLITVWSYSNYPFVMAMPTSAPRRSWPAWLRRSTFSDACRTKFGGTIHARSSARFSLAGTGAPMSDTRRSPVTTHSIRCSACRRGATRSRTRRRACA